VGDALLWRHVTWAGREDPNGRRGGGAHGR
jgi:hypothetical protein